MSCRTISSISGWISGSPPAMDTIGAPHSSTAPTACSTGMRWRRRCSGCWIFPHPAQARLHWNSGSSSRSSGNFSRRRSFCDIRYVAMRADCLIGTGNGSPFSPDLGWKLEVDLLAGDLELVELDAAESVERADHAVDERLGRGGAGGQPDAPAAGEELGRELAGVLDEQGGAARPLGDLDQPPRVGGV